MEVVAFHSGGGLLETDVVETSKTCPIYILDSVVRNQEVLFPSHEDEISFSQLFVIEVVRIKSSRILVEGEKFSPVFSIHILVSIPFPREEGMLFTDNFPVEKSDHLGVLVRQVLDLQVTTQVRVLLVHVLQYDLHIILVAFGLLMSRKSGAIVEESTRHTGLFGVDGRWRLNRVLNDPHWHYLYQGH